MKTVLCAILVTVVYATATATDPRRPSEAMIIESYESAAIAKARQRPDVIKLRFKLTTATGEERQIISAALYAILEAAASTGRQAGLAAVEQRRRADAELHKRWDEERRHEELLNVLQNLRR